MQETQAATGVATASEEPWVCRRVWLRVPVLIHTPAGANGETEAIETAFDALASDPELYLDREKGPLVDSVERAPEHDEAARESQAEW